MTAYWCSDRTARTEQSGTIEVNRFTFYYFNKNRDIGHAVHLLRIISGLRGRGLEKNDISLFCEAASLYPFDELGRLARLVILPPFKKKSLNIRQAIMRSELQRHEPCLLITGFFPFGRLECSREIKKLLVFALKKKFKIAASVPLPYFAHSGPGLRELFNAAAFYDRILVHCPPGADLRYMAKHIGGEHRIAPAQFLGAFLKLKQKIFFTGYVLPAIAEKKPLPGAFIVVQRGGGSTSPEIITKAILSARFLPARSKMRIVAGSASSPAQMRKWGRLIAKTGLKNISLEKSSPDLFSLIGSSAVCVGTAGGSVYEMLYFRKPAVLIPYKGSPGREHSDQAARAELLRDYCGAAVLEYDTLTPEGLAVEIKRALAGPLKADGRPVPQNWFNGLENTLNYLLPCKK